MRLAAVESRYFVSATQRIFHLIGTSKSGAAKYEYAHRCWCLLCKDRSWCCLRRKRSRGGYFDKTTAIHNTTNLLVIPSEVEESLALLGTWTFSLCAERPSNSLSVGNSGEDLRWAHRRGRLCS